MGRYATTTGLSIAMIGTTFDANTTFFASKCIDWAESECNKYLAKRYDLSSSTFQTATSTPPMLRALTEQIAVGYMQTMNSRGSKESIQRGESLIKMATEQLQAISDYKAHLLDTSGSQITESSNTAYQVHCSTTDYSPTFNEDDELNWSADSDKISDIEDGRD
jgi:hypothetical protein